MQRLHPPPQTGQQPTPRVTPLLASDHPPRRDQPTCPDRRHLHPRPHLQQIEQRIETEAWTKDGIKTTMAHPAATIVAGTKDGTETTIGAHPAVALNLK